jgi:NDP-sugar pyrophosphorylase family protein
MAADGYWLDTGTPDAYLRAHRDLLDATLPPPPLAGAREVARGVWAVGDSEIGGEVSAHSLVGSGAVIAPGAAVRDSVVGANASVAPGALVERSVLLPGAKVEAGARVTDSIVGHGAVVGRGAVLAAETIVGDGEHVAEGTEHSGGRLPRS